MGGFLVSTNRIYPSWDNIEKFEEPLSEGERELIVFLDENLPINWKIFVRPSLDGSYPNLFLINPEVGMMIYQVQESADDDPAIHKQQLKYYHTKIIQQLVPSMGAEIDKNRKFFALVQKGVYVYGISGESARSKYKNDKYLTVIGTDDLVTYNIENVVPSVNYSKSSYMKKEWADEIEFWLKPQLHKQVRTELKLTDKQKKNSKPNPGHHRLLGAAGSGKTLVIAHRAAQLAKDGNKVLILNYTRPLLEYIWELLDQTPYDFCWSNITIKHFHGFCNDIINEIGITRPKAELMVPVIENKMTTTDMYKFNFDSILIDEGQDYKWEWYNFLCNFLTERDELFLVCDKKQNIFDRELSWIDTAMKNVKFRGAWAKLNTVYRLPKEIAVITNKFSEEFNLDESVEMDFDQTTIVNEDYYMEWRNISTEEWLNEVLEGYENLKERNLENHNWKPSNLAILLPNNELGREAVNLFKAEGILVNHLFPNKDTKMANKRTFSKNSDSEIKISTIHKFKGREAENIILFIPESWRGDENLDSMVYTAMTRTLKNLIVINSNKRYWDFGEEYTVEEIVTEVENVSEDVEYELEDWMEKLPYPLASILWAYVSSFNYEHKVKYLLHFFEALSEFNFNLLLSGFSKDKIIYDSEVLNCITKETEYKPDWFEKPSFGVWNNLLYCISSVMRNHLRNKYNANKISKLFGKPDTEFLSMISSRDLVNLLHDISKLRNVWEGHGPRVSEEEYHERYKILVNHLIRVKNIIQDSYKRTSLVLPVQSTLKDGIHQYKVKNFMTTRMPFRPLEVESNSVMDSLKIYLINRNKRDPLELLPLIMFIDEVCYFYNGKDFETGKARYNSYYNEEESEKLISIEKIHNLTKLINTNYY